MYTFVLGLAAVQSLFFASTALAQGTCKEQTGIDLTFYGYPDGNSDTTSFECNGKIAAGGDGSYTSPESFATSASSSQFTQCEIIYLPYLQKYFQYHDHCTGCDATHIDLWIGTSTSGGQSQIDCELAFGKVTGQTIIKDPPKDLPVLGQQLWDGTCHTEAVFKNPKTDGLCSGGGNSPAPGPSSSAVVVPVPSSQPIAPSVTPISVTPVPVTPVSVTPISVTPISVTPVSVTPISVTPVSVTPVSITPTTLITKTSKPAPAPSSSSSSTLPSSGGNDQWGNGYTDGGAGIGAPCEKYEDCKGNYICMGVPKTCHDNMKD